MKGAAATSFPNVYHPRLDNFPKCVVVGRVASPLLENKGDWGSRVMCNAYTSKMTSALVHRVVCAPYQRRDDRLSWIHASWYSVPHRSVDISIMLGKRPGNRGQRQRKGQALDQPIHIPGPDDSKPVIRVHIKFQNKSRRYQTWGMPCTPSTQAMRRGLISSSLEGAGFLFLGTPISSESRWIRCSSCRPTVNRPRTKNWR